MDTVLEHWRYSLPESKGTEAALVIPDGCRDLIIRRKRCGSIEWLVSQISDQTFAAPLDDVVEVEGFRLQPGVEIDEQSLLLSLQEAHFESGSVLDRLQTFTKIRADIKEVLECLGGGAVSVAGASRLLGIGERRLQRLVMKATGRSPLFWIRLSRVRRAARSVSSADSLADLASTFRYSDQSHMTREFNQWFGVSPVQMRNGCAQREQLDFAGYF